MSLRCLTWLLLLSLVSACGAPLKSAANVGSLFLASPTLQALETQLCQDLGARTTPPTTQGLNFDLLGCQMAGLGALNYSQISAFQFVNVDGTAVQTATGTNSGSTSTAGATGTASGNSSGSTVTTGTTSGTTPATGTSSGTFGSSISLALDAITTRDTGTSSVTTTASGTTSSSGNGTGSATTSTAPATGSSVATQPPIVNKSVRAEVWLNKTFLNLATSLTAFMKKNQNAGPGVISLPSSSNAIANLATPVLTMLKPPTLNIQDLSFSMQIELQLSGIITVDQVIQIDGQLIDNAFAIVGHTVNNVPYQQSLIQSFQMVVLVIPYANDVYLDLFVNIDIYNVGLQSIFDTQLSSFLSTGLKGIIDSLIVVGGTTS